MTTLNTSAARKLEPRAPSPKRRLMMIERLSKASITVRSMASPLLPGLTAHKMAGILESGTEAGAKSASGISLRLPKQVSELF